MNMKDAFRFQNKLKNLMCEATSILQDRRNIVKVKTTHLRSKVMSDALDAVVEETAPSEYAGHANEVAAFIMLLMEEREKLSKAIHAAKSGLDLDMDNEVGLNRQRQELAEVFRHMTTLRNSEKTIAGGGSGFRFNGEGNQVSYRCDTGHRPHSSLTTSVSAMCGSCPQRKTSIPLTRTMISSLASRDWSTTSTPVMAAGVCEPVTGRSKRRAS